ncbi:MAG TPA: hypothetical protein VIM07_08740 [Chitinophagaceae bacterium]
MKKNNHHKLFIIFLFLLGATFSKTYAQDSAVSSTVLSVRYFLPENKVPYIEVSTKNKKGRKFEPVKGISVNVYLNEAGEKNLLGKTITDFSGTGRVALPASFKATWDSLNEFKFVAVSDSSAGVESLSGDVTIKKAILVIDTTSAEGVRTVTAQLKEKKGNEWVAVKEIEMKLGLKRSLGNLSVGDAETYTSDSTGMASAEFKHDSMPGDVKGNLILVARVEDNENYGNLVVEKPVPWGVASKADLKFFDQRTLWSTRFRTPLWLLFIAYSIMIGVWGTIIYLVLQIIKIKKMGKAVSLNIP